MFNFPFSCDGMIKWKHTAPNPHDLKNEKVIQLILTLLTMNYINK